MYAYAYPCIVYISSPFIDSHVGFGRKYIRDRVFSLIKPIFPNVGYRLAQPKLVGVIEISLEHLPR